MVTRKVITTTLFRNMFLETDGSATPRRVAVDSAVLAKIGPQLESIRILTITENRTSNHAWVVELSASLDGGQVWFPSTPTQLFTPITANGPVIQAEVTDRNLFCAPDLRVNLACWNGSGTARDSAYVSGIAVLTFLS